MAETLVNKNQEGEGIWTSDNLVAGSGISIQQIPQPVIDENTVELLHLNDNTTDEISNTDVYSSGGTLSYSDGKFGKCLSVSSSNATFTNQTNFKPGSDSYTIDYWFRGNSSISYPYPGVQLESTNTNGQIYFTSTTSMTIGPELTGSGSSKTFTIPSVAGKWVHIAYVHNLGDKDYLFLNGSLLESWTRTYNYNGIGFLGVLAGSTVDEVRVSNIARWTSDFTPYTEPYASSAGAPKYQINNTQDSLPSQAGNSGKYLTTDGTNASWATVSGLQNLATGSNALTLIGQASTKSNSINLGYYSCVSKDDAIAIGSYTYATGDKSIAIGPASSSLNTNTQASATDSIAIGKYARASASSAVQLGTGRNSTASTLQFLNTTVVNASGKVPMTSTDITSLTGYDASKTQVLKNVNGTLTWVDEA